MGGFGGADDEFVENQIQSEVGRKTGEQVLLEGVGRVRMTNRQGGTRTSTWVAGTYLFRQPAVMRGKAGSERVSREMGGKSIGSICQSRNSVIRSDRP